MTLREQTYDVVKEKFDSHFIVKRNVIYERVKFNKRVQREGESEDAFVTDLFCLAENCEFRNLHEETVLKVVAHKYGSGVEKWWGLRLHQPPDESETVSW